MPLVVRLSTALTAAAVIALTGCAGAVDGRDTVRFVDLSGELEFVNRPETTRSLPRTEWRFEGGDLGWRKGPGISKLDHRDGLLTGSSNAEFPILHVERTRDLDDHDLLHEVQVTMRASAGANLAVSFDDSEDLDLAAVTRRAEAFPWRTTSPLIAGDEMRHYALHPANPVTSSEIRHLLLRPTDAAGARFEIESIRLVFRREHLAGVQSGAGWHGMSGVYRESLVLRSPEIMRTTLTLPRRPWLDLAVGTLEETPVTFRVTVDDGAGDGGKILLERTVTTPHRWEEAPVDLTSYAGRKVTLSLGVEAPTDGMLGFWGSPVVRSSIESRTAGSPPSVILLWADTLRQDHLSVYGYERETSPRLESLARDGATFSSCVANATWTKVSTPSLVTSMYPPSHGVIEFADRLPASVTTLAEVYRDSGYATLSMSSVLFTGKFTNLHQGYEILHESSSLSGDRSSKTAREYVDRLLPWLGAHRDVPFFVFLHVFDPHDPFEPHPPYDALWADPDGKKKHAERVQRAREFIADPLLRTFAMPSRSELVDAGLDPDEYVRQEVDWYDGSIRGMDVEVGRVLEHLRTLGIDDKTLVVLAADHGEEFLDHGRTFHGQSVYSELTRVPLIMKGPGIPAGLSVQDAVQNIDVMPTLLELSGLPVPHGAQGRSLLPVLSGAARSGAVAASGDGPGPAAFSIKARTQPRDPAPPPRETESVAVVMDGWKLIHNLETGGEPRPRYELFDWRNDPLDGVNLAEDHPEVVERLATAIAEWRAMTLEARVGPDDESAESLSEEELQRLRSLGYIE